MRHIIARCRSTNHTIALSESRLRCLQHLIRSHHRHNGSPLRIVNPDWTTNHGDSVAEFKSSLGQGNPHPVTPWGQQTKGLKTRNNKRTQAFILRSRKKK